MFFSEVEGHMQKLSSFGQGKKISLKSHLSGYSSRIELHCYSAGNELLCKSYCDVYKIRLTPNKSSISEWSIAVKTYVRFVDLILGHLVVNWHHLKP